MYVCLVIQFHPGPSTPTYDLSGVASLQQCSENQLLEVRSSVSWQSETNHRHLLETKCLKNQNIKIRPPPPFHDSIKTAFRCSPMAWNGRSVFSCRLPTTILGLLQLLAVLALACASPTAPRRPAVGPSNGFHGTKRHQTAPAVRGPPPVRPLPHLTLAKPTPIWQFGTPLRRGQRSNFSRSAPALGTHGAWDNGYIPSRIDGWAVVLLNMLLGGLTLT